MCADGLCLCDAGWSGTDCNTECDPTCDTCRIQGADNCETCYTDASLAADVPSACV